MPTRGPPVSKVYIAGKEYRSGFRVGGLICRYYHRESLGRQDFIVEENKQKT